MSRSILRFFFFKQKTAYEMRISDWSSDVCSSDLANLRILHEFRSAEQGKDPLRLPLSLHPDQVELDVGGLAADRLCRRLAEHDVHPIDGRLPFATSAQLAGLPHHRIVEALLRSPISYHPDSGVYADSAPQPLSPRHSFSPFLSPFP